MIFNLKTYDCDDEFLFIKRNNNFNTHGQILILKNKENYSNIQNVFNYTFGDEYGNLYDNFFKLNHFNDKDMIFSAKKKSITLLKRIYHIRESNTTFKDNTKLYTNQTR